MWRELIMNASWLVATILALVGIIKTPFKGFKNKHPKWYRATFFILSLAFIVGGSVIVELFIFEDVLLSWTFAGLLITTCAGVFGGYAGYENIGLKAGLHKVFSNIYNWLSTYSDKKIAKMVGKVGIDKIHEVAKALEENKEKDKKSVEDKVAEESKLEAVVIEEQIAE